MLVAALVLIVAIVVPFAVVLCATGSIPRSIGIGIRIRATMTSDDAWETGHRAAITPTVGGGILSAVVALIAFGDPALAVFALLPLVIGVVVGAVLANRALR